MHWAIILAIAVALGWITSLFTQRYGISPLITVPIALLGAVLGAILDRVVATTIPGNGLLSFYALSIGLCVALLGGAIGWCYVIVGSERRV